MVACTQTRFAIDHVDVERNGAIADSAEEIQDLADFEGTEAEGRKKGIVSLSMQVKGKRPVSHLIARLSEIDGIVHVASLSDDKDLE